jgi:molecular chaperone Hsp33
MGRTLADHVVRALAAEGCVRALAAVTTELVEEARRRHATLPTATAALGRALTAALLLGTTLKAGERVSLELAGDGPLRGILVDATAEGTVRGFVSRPQTHLPARNGKLDVGGALGRGLLCVMRVLPEERAPYRSIVPLVSGEVGSDVASYLAGSEQTPSAVGVGVFVEPDGRVGAAGGYLLQALPGAEASTIGRLEANVATAPAPSELVREGRGAAGILRRLLAGFVTRVVEERPVRFQCPCSRERVTAAIIALGRADLTEVLVRERRAEVVCEFCRERYVVGEAELAGLIAGAGGRPA